jgi:putative transposase
VTLPAQAEMEPLVGIASSCELTGTNRASLYRWRSPKPKVVGPRPAPAAHPAALDDGERARVLEILRAERFVDKSPAQIWATILDEGQYVCSISTMYRLLRHNGEVRERRRQATHPAKVKPELEADGPDQVWSWDITKLKGPWRGVYYDLMVMLDIYSRKAVHWKLIPVETGQDAKEFMQEAFVANGGVTPEVVHADRGTSMTSKCVADLLDELKISRSHSRPKVSNDNPYSEANFKTLKYCPAFPERFDSFEQAEQFADDFFTYYNTEHRHSGSACTPPPRFTTAPRRTSARNEPTSSPRPTPPTPAGSEPSPSRRLSLPPPASTHRPGPRRRPTTPSQNKQPELSQRV